MALTEFTDAELDAEIKRLVKLYPSVELPTPPEVDADLKRIWELQYESHVRWHERTGHRGILSLYNPLFISRAVDPNDIHGKIRRPEDPSS